jgi:protein involved in polysaccharide export with SLBB domain
MMRIPAFLVISRLHFLLTASIVTGLLLGSSVVSAKDERKMVDAKDLPPVITEEYRIHVGDVLAISFLKPADLTQTRTVGPDGNIHLLIIGRVVAAGRTVEELTRELTERYRESVINPQITVSLDEISTMRIYVGGEVNEPGVLPYRGGMTLVQALFNAGGFSNNAHLSNVVLIRNGPNDEPVGTLVNVKDVLKKARFDRDVDLAPLDIIFVPRSKIAQVNLFVEQFIRNNLPVDFYIGFWPQGN